MIKINRIFSLILFSLLLLVMLAGSVSARVEIYNGTITEGDGYQINNFVIDVTDVFVSANTVVFKVYERNELKVDMMISRNDSIKFDFNGGEVELKLMSVFSATLPRAKIFITVSNYNIANLHVNEVINGGHEYATYSGTPIIEIIKTVDEDDIVVGDSITVTVTAKNTGDDKATNVIFSDPKQEHFILDKSILEPIGPMSMDVGSSQTVFVYMLKATQAGTFTLKQSTATFSNSADQGFPQASSTTPTVTVTDIPKKKAVLEISTDVDSMIAARNDHITTTINVKNTGDAPASAVWINMMIPQHFEYVSGDSSIEIIDGVPKIYMESFGPQQEKEFTYTTKVNELGTYTLATKLSYEYDNGVDIEKQKIRDRKSVV